MDKDYYKEHRKNSFKQWAYSVQRIDLLIVSISGAGIYVVLESLKYSIEHTLCNSLLLKICGVIFVITLVVNFISQCTGERVNEQEIKWADEKLEENEIQAKTHEVNSDFYNKATGILNMTSMIGMFLGLGCLITYFFITF